MKKILLVAMVAFAFMACSSDKNGASVPSGDKKAVKAVTAEAVDLVGESPAKVDKSLTAAGFKKVEASELEKVVARAQARVKKQKAHTAEGEVEVTYVYNYPDNFWNISEEEEVTAYVKSLFAKGKCLVMVVAVYVDDKLTALSTNVMAPIKDGISLLYAENSDALYAQLPAINGQTSFWEGHIYSGESGKDYTDHAAYVAAVTAAKSIDAEEWGYAITNMDMTAGSFEGFGFYAVWVLPDDEDQSEMEEEMGFAYAYGNFSVVDYASLMQR